MKLNRKSYETTNEKRIDFVVGFFGWFVVNVVVAFIWMVVSSAVLDLFDTISTHDPLASIYYYFDLLLPLLFNIGLILLLAFTRKWMALGALAAFTASLALVVVLGVFLIAACYGNM